MQQNKLPFKEMLERYRMGRSPQNERSRIINWLIGLDLFHHSISDEQIATEQQRSMAQLRAKHFPEAKAKMLRLPVWAKIAAAAVLLIAVGLWQYQRYLAADGGGVQWAEISTGTGQIKQITLSDGSQIVLNGLSRLRYPMNFRGDRREVFLQGQGFFRVAHDAKKAFSVQTGPMRIQVLGTSFDIKAYANDPDIEVGVATGKVGVLGAGTDIKKVYFLTPGQILSYRLKTHVATLNTVEAASLGIWQQRRLIYKNQSLETITRELQRYYKVSFVFADPELKQKKFSLNIRNQKLEMVMKALSVSGGFNYRINKATITVW